MEVSDSYFGRGRVDGKPEQVCQVKKMILVEIKCKQHLGEKKSDLFEADISFFNLHLDIYFNIFKIY